MIDQKFIQVVMGFGVALVVAIAGVFVLCHERHSLDRAQVEFELQEKRWNWQGWHADGSLVCQDKGEELRGCRVFIPVHNGVFGEPHQQLVVFSCTPYACDWLLSPETLEP